MTSAYGSSGSFESIVGSKYVGHNKYTGRIKKFHSKQTAIHGPFHRTDLNYSYSRSQFSRLTQ